jgi:hypothetical protein
MIASHEALYQDHLMGCMGFKILGSLHVIVNGADGPEAKEWGAYAQALQAEVKRGIDVTEFRTIVFSEGGGPNASQRKTIADLLQGKPSPIAIVSGNPLMRTIITALSWFNPKCKSFSPSEVGRALDHLGVPHLKFESIRQAALEIQKNIGLQRVVALEQARLTGTAQPSAGPQA